MRRTRAPPALRRLPPAGRGRTASSGDGCRAGDSRGARRRPRSGPRGPRPGCPSAWPSAPAVPRRSRSSRSSPPARAPPMFPAREQPTRPARGAPARRRASTGAKVACAASAVARASSAQDSPSAPAASAYSSDSVVPEIVRLSVFRPTLTPPRSSAANGWRDGSGTAPVCTLLRIAISRWSPRSRSSETSSASSAAPTPWAMRSGASSASASRTAAAPPVSPACVARASPASRARRAARASGASAAQRLVARHVEGDHAAAGPGRRAARLALGPVRAPAAEHHRDEAERRRRRRARRLHRGLHHRVPETVVVGGRPKPHLRVDDAVRHQVGGELRDDARDAVRALHGRVPGGEARQVGREPLARRGGRVAVRQRRRQTVGRDEGAHGRGAHGARRVEVELDLGRLAEAIRLGHRRAAPRPAPHRRGCARSRGAPADRRARSSRPSTKTATTSDPRAA